MKLAAVTVLCGMCRALQNRQEPPDTRDLEAESKEYILEVECVLGIQPEREHSLCPCRR
jgi:hypothetical protein